MAHGCVWHLCSVVVIAFASASVMVVAQRQALGDGPAKPLDGSAWMAEATALAGQGKTDAAIAAIERARDLGAASNADILVQRAALEAHAGRVTDALDTLRKAIRAGYRFRASLSRDRRFTSLPADALAQVAGIRTTSGLSDAEARRQDLAFLEEEVRRLHPRGESFTADSAFGLRVARLGAQLDRLSDTQFTIEIQRVLASVGDGHTLLVPFGMSRGALSRVPAALYWFDDGLFITNAKDPTLVGARLQAVNGIPIEDVIGRLRPLLSVDNEMHFRWAAPLYLTFPEFAAAAHEMTSAQTVWRVISGSGSRDVELAGEPVDPDQIDTHLAPPPAAPAPRFLAHRSKNAWFEPVAPAALYVQINAMSNAADETLSAFARRLHEHVAAARPRVMILDLRHNSGGDAPLADELLKTLMAFDLEGGKLYVLIGRATFSAAETFTARLDAWTAAVFLGEPTGSRPNHYGNEAPFVLPYSGLRGTISSGFNQPVTSRDHRVWIAPEVPVAYTAADYFSGADPVLDRAIAEAVGSPRH